MPNKLNYFKVNVSSTFLYKSVCAKCGKGPLYYVYNYQPTLWKNPRQSIEAGDWFRVIFKSISDMGRVSGDIIPHYHFSLEGKSYNPAAHKSNGFPTLITDHIVEFLYCQCGETLWAFNNKSIKNKSEVFNRKGKYSFPKKFTYRG